MIIDLCDAVTEKQILRIESGYPPCSGDTFTDIENRKEYKVERVDHLLGRKVGNKSVYTQLLTAYVTELGQ